jgi:hypothetical protein
MSYDECVHRLQNLPSFTLSTIQEDGSIVPWWTVNPADLVPTLILRHARLHEDIQQIGVQIFEWARHVALAQRVWEIRERRLRVWKAEAFAAAKEKDPKAAKYMVEEAYRQLPDYENLCSEVDKAAEVHQCAQGVLDALKAKRDMLRSFVRRGRDGNPEILAD